RPTYRNVGTSERAVAASGIEVTSVAEAPVPLADAEHSRFVFFREGGGFLEHVAVLIGPRESWPDPVPVRLHSACLTGDLFGSLRCDCGEQLRGSFRHFKNRGGGVLVYLAQEGRGIGLGNKIGLAVVRIVDNLGIPVPDVIVFGTFTGSFEDSGAGLTGVDGFAAVATTINVKDIVVGQFCVDDALDVNLVLIYNPAQNVETCDTF
ncbi:hypothetical protein IH785_15695, partial [candidate division KSB1 bacterium]|nr:hypothetical protein [candidate division KSB1 bacterium]